MTPERPAKVDPELGWMTAFLILAVAVVLMGCGHNAPSTGANTNVQSAFQTTPAAIREFAEQGVEAEGKGDFGTAFVHYRALSLNPELTPEQRNTADRSMLEMGKKLRDAAARGDQDANKVLENYRSTR